MSWPSSRTRTCCTASTSPSIWCTRCRSMLTSPAYRTCITSFFRMSTRSSSSRTTQPQNSGSLSSPRWARSSASASSRSESECVGAPPLSPSFGDRVGIGGGAEGPGFPHLPLSSPLHLVISRERSEARDLAFPPHRQNLSLPDLRAERVEGPTLVCHPDRSRRFGGGAERPAFSSLLSCIRVLRTIRGRFPLFWWKHHALAW